MERNSPILGIRSDQPTEAATVPVKISVNPKKDFDHAVKMLRACQGVEDTGINRQAAQYWKDQIKELCLHNEDVRMNLYEMIGII